MQCLPAVAVLLLGLGAAPAPALGAGQSPLSQQPLSPQPLSPRTHQLSLDGSWTLTCKAIGLLQLPATVPGGVYSDLRAADTLKEDIFFRFNEREYRWVGKEDWIYERFFRVAPDVLAKDKQVLVLHGVDTVGEVRLNGHLLGRTDNMFLRYRFDVKGILQEVGNTLKVRLLSPVKEAARRAAEQAKSYVVPPACPDANYHGECGANHLRKMQASFAWDWGPAFPSLGLWKSVQIEAYDEAVLRDVGFSTSSSTSTWTATARVFWEVGTAAAAEGTESSAGAVTVALASPDGNIVATQSVAVDLKGDAEGLGHTDVVLTVPKSDVQLWWPRGYGAPNLYTLTATLRIDDAYGGILDRVAVKVGFREVELVQDLVVAGDASKGRTFFFRVNGQPVFIKGSNWIPAHILPERGADPQTVGHLLHSAAEANMNMLRVWGGGLYESDLFYELADELGLLIWQDMMFACSMYPVGDAFLSNVDAEVRQQYRRLNHHPSVVLWAANNENEAALRGSWYGTAGDLFDQYHKDYVKLYVDTVRAAVRDEGATVPFAVSSPSNGAESETEDFLAKDPYSPLYGDDHHYDYVSDAWNPAVFHHSRFGSEYGFMSWPMRSTMLEATDSNHADTDLAIGSDLAIWRQHHAGGNEEIVLQIKQHLSLPANYNDSQHYATFAYLNQIYQGVATKSETEFLRRSRNLLTAAGEGQTMGALYWQLNDVWQAPSWAGIDFSGRWKILHHLAVDFFAPLLVSPHLEVDVLAVDVVSDAALNQVVQVHTDVLSMDSFAPLHQRVDSVAVGGAGSTPRALETPLEDLLTSAGCSSNALTGCLLRFRVTADDNTTVLAPDNFLFPRSPKDTPMSTVTFKVSGVSGPLAGTRHQKWDYTLRLTASSPAAFVWLDAGPFRGRFSRNAFHLTEAEPLELRFHTDERPSAARLARHLSVTALNGQYVSRRAGRRGGPAP